MALLNPFSNRESLNMQPIFKPTGHMLLFYDMIDKIQERLNIELSDGEIIILERKIKEFIYSPININSLY
jgi:hypothetical protein